MPSKYQYSDIHQYFDIINILKIINTLLNFINTGAGAGTLSLHEYKYPDKVHRDGFLKYFHKLYLLFHSIGSKKTGKIGLRHMFCLYFNIVIQRSKDGQGVPGSLKLLQQHQVSSDLCELWLAILWTLYWGDGQFFVAIPQWSRRGFSTNEGY